MLNQKPILEFDQGTLTLRHLPSQIAQKLGIQGTWKWDTRTGAWRSDALHYSGIVKNFQASSGQGPMTPEITENQIVSIAESEKDYHSRFPTLLEDRVPKWQSVTFSRVNLPPLRAEQKEAVERWIMNRSGVIVMPTGTGKTEVALMLIRHLACSTLVVVPIRDLMYQWHRRIFSAFHYDAGIVGDGQFDVRPITVTTYDSVAIHMNKLGNLFSFVIFDECHHLPGRFLREASLMCAAPCRLGLTATPERADGRHTDLDFLIGPIVYHIALPLVKGSTLADYDIVRIPVHLSPEEQLRYDRLSSQIRHYMIARRKQKKDYRWEDLLAESGTEPESRAVQRAFYVKQAIEDRAEEKMRILEDIFRLHAGTRIIVFTGSNAMARAISLRFLVPSILSNCGKEERNEILSGFAQGKYPAIVANRILDEGVDVPEAKVAVILGGLGSTRQATQRLGRVLRKTGNERAVLYEVVCEATREEARSRNRRRTEAYSHVKRTFHPD